MAITPESLWYRKEIEAAAAKYGLDRLLVYAVVEQESGGRTDAYRFEPLFWVRYLAKLPAYAESNPRRVSASYGLMQIMYPVAKDAGFADLPEDLFKPEIGLNWGCQRLAALLAWAKGSPRQALAAYNGGKGGNEREPLRNGAYANQVFARLAYLKGVLNVDPAG